jgi:hypothetical protein
MMDIRDTGFHLRLFLEMDFRTKADVANKDGDMARFRLTASWPRWSLLSNCMYDCAVV